MAVVHNWLENGIQEVIYEEKEDAKYHVWDV